MAAANFFFSLCVIAILFLHCKGVQSNFRNVCTFPHPLQSEILHEISIRAEVNYDFSCEEKRINLYFSVPEERGEPCLRFRNNNAAGNYKNWQDTCNFTGSYFSSYGNGTYNYTELKLFLNGPVTWDFKVYGNKSGDEACDMWLDISIFNGCMLTSEPSTSLTVSTTVSTRRDSSKESILPVIYSVIIAVIVFLILALIYFALTFFQRRRMMRANFYEVKISQFDPLTIFVVFSDEHPFHKEVVLRFTNFLKARYGFKTILDLYDRETIYENPAAWLEKSLLSSDVVLVIWSPGAEERWKNPEQFTDNSQDLPKSVQSNSIPCIKLMTDFYRFCNKMIDLSKNSKSFSKKSKLLISKESSELTKSEANDLQKIICEMNEVVKNKNAQLGPGPCKQRSSLNSPV